MKAAQFEYIRPPDLGKALQLLSERREEAKVLAGGQSLGPMLNLRLGPPSPTRASRMQRCPEPRCSRMSRAA
jgi:CO/xanthine dehydrogenase FAD-binding subunit